jgi:hypothetical protein
MRILKTIGCVGVVAGLQLALAVPASAAVIAPQQAASVAADIMAALPALDLDVASLEKLGKMARIYNKLLARPLGLTPMAAPIPEPASWMMMIAGFGAVGFVLRRSRRLAVA